MTTSAQLSYRLHLVNTSIWPGRDLINWYADYTGVYDPRTRSGAGVNILRRQSGSKVDGRIQVRIVGDNYYTRSGNGKPWFTGRGGTLVQALVLNGGVAWARPIAAPDGHAVLRSPLSRPR